MIIESRVVKTGVAATKMHELLREPANFEELLPDDHVHEFTSTDGGCAFKVTGGFNIFIKRTEEDAPERIRFESQKGTPIRFTLDILIRGLGDASCDVQVKCDADLNPFMKMMAEKPLQAIFNGMGEAIAAKFPA